MDYDIIKRLVTEERELNLGDYPKQVWLENDTRVMLRPMVRADEYLLLDFFKSLPESERLYLKDDIVNARVIRDWARNIDYEKVLPVLAIVGDRVVGNCSLHRYPGTWMKNTGHITITVSPDHRHNGLIKILATEVFYMALSADLERIVVELDPVQVDIRKVFKELGLYEEIVLKDKHVDVNGGRHDLLIMDADFNRFWRGWMEHYELASGA